VLRPLARLVSLAAVALAVGIAPRPALAGDLNQVESAHKDKPKDKGGDPDGASSSSSSSSSKRSSGGSGSNVAGSILGGLVSGLFGSSGGTSEDDAVTPPRSLAMLSYADDDSSSAYTALAGPEARMRRYGELSLSGFSAVTSTVRALDAQLNLFLRAWTIHAAVGRFYEPDATNLRTLDVLRLQIGWNLFHGWVEAAELHVTGGVLALHGNDWTPGGSARADLRVYPIHPVSLDAVMDATFFAHGPPLIEAALLPGVTFARLDLRLGAGLLYQSGVTPIFGPRLQAGIRF
jgi:hypothetical protein